ncbi:MAG: PD-(D/E)XK nuclease family protein [bacterium]
MQHLEACPLRRDDLVAAYPEQGLTAWDTDVDVVMSTRADLVVETADAFIVRETKSVAEAEVAEAASEVFARYPQVAVALCLLADGLDPLRGQVAEQPRTAYVELELLSESGHEIRSFDAADAELVLQARAVVADAVDRILYDSPEPHVGHWCAWCPVSKWCLAYSGIVYSEEESDEAPPGEVETGTVPSRVALLAYAEDIAVVDDDIPY